MGRCLANRDNGRCTLGVFRVHGTTDDFPKDGALQVQRMKKASRSEERKGVACATEGS